MVRSMTGFASITATVSLGGEPADIVVTLKAFNSRFFEAACKLSHSLSILEVDVTRRLKNALTRGTIQCHIHARSNHAALGARVVPAWQTLDGYIAAEQAISARYGLTGHIDAKTLLTLPHALDVVETSLAPEEHAAILAIVDRAIKTLDEDRQREGAALHGDLNGRIAEIEHFFAIIPPRAELIITQRRADLIAQLEKLLQSSTQETRDQQLVALDQQLNRLDIHEEVARFATHLKQLHAILNDSNSEKGKRLEFTLQELLREINTMAAKCPDSELTPAAISIKVELEKVREQAQNIV